MPRDLKGDVVWHTPNLKEWYFTRTTWLANAKPQTKRLRRARFGCAAGGATALAELRRFKNVSCKSAGRAAAGAVGNREPTLW